MATGCSNIQEKLKSEGEKPEMGVSKKDLVLGGRLRGEAGRRQSRTGG